MKLKILVVFIVFINIQFCFSISRKNIPNDVYYFTQALCYEYNIDFEMCLAILLVENPTFNRNAKNINSNGTVDCGLWQLNSKYLIGTFFSYVKNKESVADFDVYDWKQNTYMAINHIKFLYSKLNTFDDIVCAYNCGIGAVQKKQVPKLTKVYMQKVKNNYEKLKESA